MSYRVTVVKIEENPHWTQEAEDEAARVSQYGYQVGHRILTAPARTVEARTLDVVLTDEEYERVKRAVLEGWR